MKKILYTDNEKHLIYQNKYIEIGSTGHIGDFCGFIVNKTNFSIELKDDIDGTFIKIDPNNGIGIFYNEENKNFISNLIGNIKKEIYNLYLYMNNNEYGLLQNIR